MRREERVGEGERRGAEREREEWEERRRTQELLAQVVRVRILLESQEVDARSAGQEDVSFARRRAERERERRADAPRRQPRLVVAGLADRKQRVELAESEQGRSLARRDEAHELGAVLLAEARDDVPEGADRRRVLVSRPARVHGMRAQVVDVDRVLGTACAREERRVSEVRRGEGRRRNERDAPTRTASSLWLNSRSHLGLTISLKPEKKARHCGAIWTLRR